MCAFTVLWKWMFELFSILYLFSVYLLNKIYIVNRVLALRRGVVWKILPCSLRLTSTILIAVKFTTDFFQPGVWKCRLAFKCSRLSLRRITCRACSMTCMSSTMPSPTRLEEKPLLRIRIHKICMFSGLLDPDPDQLVRGTDPDPDPSISKPK